MSIAGASILLVIDEITEAVPWALPVWSLCRALGAVGFERIELCGGAEWVEDFSDLMRGMMFIHTPHLDSLPSRVDEDEPFNLVFYLGNDPELRERSAKIASAVHAPARAISWGTTWLAMESWAEGEGSKARSDAPAHATSPQPLAPVARVAAGLALQEALIIAGRLAQASEPDPLVLFDASSESRGAGGDPSSWEYLELEPAVVEVVGAGGIGTHFLEAIAPVLSAGSALRIFDFDRVAPENLAVQSAFERDHVGLPKAEVMAEKLQESCDIFVDIEPYVMRYEDRPLELSPPTLRVLCPDTFRARARANDRSLLDRVPFVEAGTSPLGAQERSYLPGTTACLEHRIRELRRRVKEERDRDACGFNHAITLPGTNMIAGGLLAVEAMRTLEPDRLGPPSVGTIMYDARFPRRFGIVEPRPPCSH
jgi:molybdopterin/thiamine biosynthesis adenylyltransferase